jgi:hypothetical protein
MSTSTSSAPLTGGPTRRVHPAWIVSAVLLLVAIGAVLLLVARSDDEGTATVIRGSGVPAVAERDLPPFTAVDLGGANDVTLRMGDAQSVTVYADDNLIDLVTTEVRDGTLVIGNEESFSTVSPMRVEVVAPVFAGVELTGSGTITVSNLDVVDLVALLSGSGVIEAEGKAERLDATLAGSGQLELGDLVARQATAVLAGSGEIRIHATEMLDATVSGVGTIEYAGDPESVTQAVTGSGTITATG